MELITLWRRERKLTLLSYLKIFKDHPPNTHTQSIRKDIEQLKLLYSADGSIKWYNHFEKLFDSIYEAECIHIL